jgi:hypothetical protein
MESVGIHFIVRRGRALFGALQGHHPFGQAVRNGDVRSPDQAGDTATEMADLLRLALALAPDAGPVGVVMAPGMARSLRWRAPAGSDRHRDGGADGPSSRTSPACGTKAVTMTEPRTDDVIQ